MVALWLTLYTLSPDAICAQCSKYDFRQSADLDSGLSITTTAPIGAGFFSGASSKAECEAYLTKVRDSLYEKRAELFKTQDTLNRQLFNLNRATHQVEYTRLESAYKNAQAEWQEATGLWTRWAVLTCHCTQNAPPSPLTPSDSQHNITSEKTNRPTPTPSASGVSHQPPSTPEPHPEASPTSLTQADRLAILADLDRTIADRRLQEERRHNAVEAQVQRQSRDDERTRDFALGKVAADSIEHDTVGSRGPATVMGISDPFHSSTTRTQNVITAITPTVVSRWYPSAAALNVSKYAPAVLRAIDRAGWANDDVMIAYVFGTIAAENSRFDPGSEDLNAKGRYANTLNLQRPFGKYDEDIATALRLGNSIYGEDSRRLHDIHGDAFTDSKDGERYKGRGFIQLTGRSNYLRYGQSIGLGSQLEERPERASDPDTAAMLLVAFLKPREEAIHACVASDDLACARRLVNTVALGLDRFEAVYSQVRKTAR